MLFLLQESLNSFLSAAEELAIKGLTTGDGAAAKVNNI